MPFIPLLALLIAAACAPAAVVTQQPAEAERSWAAIIDVQATPLPLNPQDPSQTVVGRLRYMGGLHLTSSDPRFGGLSGLRWQDGQLLAVSDEGDFFRMTLEERDEWLVGVHDVRMRRLTRPDGQPLSGKAESDAEALELHTNVEACRIMGEAGCAIAEMIVAFEGTNRLWAYRMADGLPHGAPTELSWSAEWRRALPHNGGVEAIAAGWLLAETVREPNGWVSGRLREWYREGGSLCFHHCPLRVHAPVLTRETPMSMPVAPDFAPTDADAGMYGEPFFVLQRRYVPGEGNTARIVRLQWARDDHGVRMDNRITDPEMLAELAAPLTVDNFEGLAFRFLGGSYIYIVSDNNFSSTQRTLLLKFQVID